ncbi:MAG: dephospho-CoA kinase [Flammeovirgaceae bacterium]
MLQIGITGGIGSGKSLVSRVFHALGVDIYDSDTEAKLLMKTHPEIRRGLISLFGSEVYDDKGELNSQHISRIAFDDKTVLEKLNALVHPQVKNHYLRWADKQKIKGKKYVIKESALLFEIGASKDYDAVILVTASESVRIERVKARDTKRTEEQIKAIMKKQMPESEKEKLTKYIIRNEGNHPILPQILALHDNFSKGIV